MLKIRYLHLFFRCNNTKRIIYLAWPTINNTAHDFMHRFSCDSIAAYIAVDLSCGIRSLFIRQHGSAVYVGMVVVVCIP